MGSTREPGDGRRAWTSNAITVGLGNPTVSWRLVHMAARARSSPTRTAPAAY